MEPRTSASDIPLTRLLNDVYNSPNETTVYVFELAENRGDVKSIVVIGLVGPFTRDELVRALAGTVVQLEEMGQVGEAHEAPAVPWRFQAPIRNTGLGSQDSTD